MELERGRQLFGDGDGMAHAYFPHDCVVSLVSVMHDGRSVEMNGIGREGFIDPALALRAVQPLGRYLVQLPGTAWRIEVERLNETMAISPALRAHLMCYTEVFLRQSLQLVACSALHPVEARICRWILTTRDRLARPECPVTQDVIGEVLGVQRSTVSLAVRNLQAAGLIGTRRGAIEILEPDGLFDSACECYSIIRRHFEERLPGTYG
ncbi:cAMP-binding protein [Lutibaculum baratangense AMV1]|uniref:cAMP-binding protein n=1 Tax=Lutibaculum baratangense AMV1 TaxID=631454 RepID=V4RFK0_9HYPH|nr:cAMP-binding protein [Lutibaculum baratangense AMV1]